ncbi:hypothetical protein CLV90_0984 [Maribacter spongiicola]|uniref:Uncharacterized protein n=1 Tax=Maribacter spongiicola TaxID=1206753 RepID=A0A4R7K7N4_9FLAO|nr:hypothetical protein [Maribacter spongiicola]TDT46919.1 hypothetical protein CLV90_0984 [Maribacter spongiicola]
MEEKFNGNRNKFSRENLKLFDDIARLDINYCECYAVEDVHPDFALCSKCELVVPGTDESEIKFLVSITGNYNLLKPKD